MKNQIEQFRFTLIIAALFGLCLINSEQAIAQIPSARTTQFINGKWIDGNQFRQRIFYVVNGKLTVKKPAKIDDVVDLKNDYVIAPFAEAHSHEFDNKSEFASQSARFLHEGTLYVMVLTNGANNAAFIRPQLNQPNTPDVLFANGGITHTGQHPSFAYERNASGIKDWWMPENSKRIQANHKEENNSYWFFDTLQDVEKKWPLFYASKPDIVKIYLLDVKNNAPAQKSITEEVAAAIIKKAHEAGLRVAAHIETFDDLKLGIKIGVDIFAHMPYYNVLYAPSEPAQPTFSPVELTTIRKKNLVVIPTLSLNEDYAIIRDASNNYQGKFNKEKFNYALNFQKKTLATLRNAGFTFAIGSDRNALTPELNYWIKNQVFDLPFVIQTATVTTPQLLFPQRKIGLLREGYEASFLVLEKNPLTDVEAIKTIQFRYKQGNLLSLAK